jgi:hypothetical protein
VHNSSSTAATGATAAMQEARNADYLRPASATGAQLDELLEEAIEIQRLPLPPDERHPSSSHHSGRIRSSHYRCRSRDATVPTGVKSVLVLVWHSRPEASYMALH